MNPVVVERGSGPVVLGFPHAGTWLPPEVATRLTDSARRLIDTDWHVDQLYAGLLPEATTVRANFHRYLIDANRDPEGVSLYPGQNTTGLVPVTDFDGQPLWHHAPAQVEIDQRLHAWHQPYHRQLEAELARAQEQHGVAVLLDCHSIRSRIPFLFDGQLPDLNLGTDGGVTCDRRIEAVASDICDQATDYTWVLNGRFRGGWTTRHYGQPARGRHALQLELAQSTYLADERETFAMDSDKSQRLRIVLKQLLESLQRLAVELADAAKERS